MINCKVCIIGAGSAGMGAAYALRHLKQDLVLVEKHEDLGGTAVNAWVETWIAGINPPYLLKILEDPDIKKNISDDEIDNSWLPTKFSIKKDKKIDDGMTIDHAALAKRYCEDMAEIRIYNNCTFQSAKVEEIGESKKVKSIEIKDKHNNIKEIFACFFIDSTGSGDLCRFVNPDKSKDPKAPGFYYGEDDNERFNESLASPPNEANASNMNEPSLFYKVLKSGKENSNVENAKPSDQVSDDGYVNDFLPDNSRAPFWVNPMTGLGINGIDIINDGMDEVYTKASELQYEHWKTVKDALTANKNCKNYRGYHPQRQINYVHSGQFAPMLGVRETYRINCEKMLTQNHLKEKINSSNLQDFIACGSHPIDMHLKGSISGKAIDDFNSKYLVPSGIPYYCIVPLRISNVLIACRAYGASHIALAARRTNKDMAQLGWAAGHAVNVCFENCFDNIRSVYEKNKIKDLQKKIDLESSIKKLESLLS